MIAATFDKILRGKRHIKLIHKAMFSFHSTQDIIHSCEWKIDKVLYWYNQKTTWDKNVVFLILQNNNFLTRNSFCGSGSAFPFDADPDPYFYLIGIRIRLVTLMRSGSRSRFPKWCGSGFTTLAAINYRNWQRRHM